MQVMRIVTLVAAASMGMASFAVQAQSGPATQAGVASAPGKVAGAATAQITAKGVAVDPAQRGQVEMVEVHVRDEHRVELLQQLVLDLGVPLQVEHPPSENGVGDDPRAVQVDDDGAVP